jgi:hypothetical protein
MSFLKLVQNRCKGVIEPDMSSILAMSSDNPTDERVPSTTNDEEQPQQQQQQSTLARSLSLPVGQLLTKSLSNKIGTTKKVLSTAIEFALNQVIDYTLARNHEDIDISNDACPEPSDEEWTQFIEQFYSASQSVTTIEVVQYDRTMFVSVLSILVHMLTSNEWKCT